MPPDGCREGKKIPEGKNLQESGVEVRQGVRFEKRPELAAFPLNRIGQLIDPSAVVERNRPRPGRFRQKGKLPGIARFFPQMMPICGDGS
jgi:hypothetical protein